MFKKNIVNLSFSIRRLFQQNTCIVKQLFSIGRILKKNIVNQNYFLLEEYSNKILKANHFLLEGCSNKILLNNYFLHVLKECSEKHMQYMCKNNDEK